MRGRACDNQGIAEPTAPRRLDPGLRLLLGAVGGLALLGHLQHPDGRFTRGGLPHGDGLYHYAQVRSLVLDRDLRLGNDYARLGNPHHQPTRDDGWAGNHFTMGTALTWVPAFVVAHGLSRAGDAMGWWTDPGDGTSARCQRWTMLGSVAAAWLALLLVARMLRARFGPRTVGLSVVLAAVATPLWWYATRQPSFSHAASALAVAGLLHATATGGPQHGLRRGATVGLWLGLSALVRPQDVVFAAWPLLLGLLALRSPATRRSAAGGLLAMLGVAALCWLPQAWVWQQAQGSAWQVPQGPEFLRWGESQWDLVLWSSRGGLLSWSPAVAVGLVGLGVAAVRGSQRRQACALSLSLLLAVFVCGAVDDWWGGWAFGARRLTGAAVVFALGFATLLQPLLDGPRRSWVGRALVVVGALGSVRLSMQMQDDLLEGRLRRGVPQRLAPAWSRAFGLPLDAVLETTGTPGSWPASWVFAWRTGAAPGRYDLAAGWALVRSRGDDKGYDRLWLEDDRWALSGFGPVTERRDHHGRAVQGHAAIGIPLRTALTLDGRLRLWAATPTELRVEGWGDPLTLSLRAGWHDYPLPTITRPAGLHVLTLHATADPPVEAAWLDVFEPGRDPVLRSTPDDR